MKAQVKKWGNSLAVRIPSLVAEELRLTEDAPIQLEIEDGKLVIRPLLCKREYTLEELLEGVTPENVHDEIQMGGPVGGEIW